MAIYFTADTHFGHEKVIKFQNRPFANAAEIDAALLANWAAVVKPGDKVYHLGDVAFGNKEKVTGIARLIKKLPGQKFLIPGNHDSDDNLEIFENEKAFTILPPRYELNINGFALPADVTPPTYNHGTKQLEIVLDHYPLMSWNRSGYGALHLHGHCHACVPATSQRLDVGVDAWNYAPASLEDVLRRLAAAPPGSTRAPAARPAPPCATPRRLPGSGIASSGGEERGVHSTMLRNHSSARYNGMFSIRSCRR